MPAQNGCKCMVDQFPARSADYLSSQNSGCVIPTMELEKSCMTKQRTAAQKCMNRTNIYRNNDNKKLIIILLQEFTIDNLKRRK